MLSRVPKSRIIVRSDEPIHRRLWQGKIRAFRGSEERSRVIGVTKFLRRTHVRAIFAHQHDAIFVHLSGKLEVRPISFSFTLSCLELFISLNFLRLTLISL